jgi:hypothetical protein
LALGAQAESAFVHRSAWARVLHESYNHQPCYVCRFTGDRVEGLLPIMEVSSIWSGRRGVSLPFTDFCPWLQTQSCPGRELYEYALEYGHGRGWRYLECRNTNLEWPGARPSVVFYGHTLGLGCGPKDLFGNFDPATRRGVRKAQAAGLQVEFAASFESMRTFYALHCRTRQRLGVPPQPMRFFENIAQYVLGEGLGVVGIVRLGKQAIAAAVFFHFGRQALFKFGATDYKFQSLRPNNFLMWEAIQRYAREGFASLHLGRTSLANEGLRRFKLGFGAAEETIAYFRYDLSKGAFVAGSDHSIGWQNRVFRRLPLPLLRLAGNLLYPHLS